MREKLIALTRISLGWIFFWAFMDKLFGLGFATTAEKAWLAGGSPTTGFLKFGTSGPFADIFQSMAGNIFVDILFMAGLGLIGISLLLGIGLEIAAVSGAVLMLLMYIAASLPPEHNPLIDDHIMYAFLFLLLPYLNAGDTWGLGKKWKETNIVKKYKWLT